MNTPRILTMELLNRTFRRTNLYKNTDKETHILRRSDIMSIPYCVLVVNVK